MNDTTLTNSAIESRYRERTPNSAARTTEAREIFPSGIVHDSRKTSPYPVYIERAKGPRKWDIDGHEYVDYFGGHGALILGHGHPKVLEAVHAQLELGTHFGACHESEMRWGSLVKALVPCAERVRFHSSGTEANLMALRLARAYTGRAKVVRFMGHFHGWQDHVAFGVDNHLDGSAPIGVIEGIAENVILADSQNVEGTVALLESRDDIAAVILEPTGGSFGMIPLPENMRSELRRVTSERGIVLIFDEVVTGFRVSTGGAQGHHGITPDIASYAKIVAGGLPGGCIAGRKDILDYLDFEVAEKKGVEKVGHQGTYNANPACAAAGIAALEILQSEDVCGTANASAQTLRDGINGVFAEESVPWYCYGEHSAFYVFTDPDKQETSHANFNPMNWSLNAIKRSSGPPAVNKFRLALLNEGVDISGKPGGLLSCTHTAAELDHTVSAVRNAVKSLQAEGEIS